MSAKKGLNAYAADICRMHDEGLSQSQLAQIYGTTPRSIGRLISRHGITPHSHGFGRRRQTADLYTGAHNRVRKTRGTPSRCERCGKDDPAARYEWANLTGNYADVNDYERMCVPCHRGFDAARRRATGAPTITIPRRPRRPPRLPAEAVPNRELTDERNVTSGQAQTPRH